MCRVKFFETLWRFIAEHDNTTESVDYNSSSSVDLTVHASPQVLKQVQAMVSVYTNPQQESQTSLVVTLDLVHRLLIHEKQWSKIDPTATQHLSKDNECKHDLTRFAHLMDGCLVCGIVRTNLEVPLKCRLDAFCWLVANCYDAVVSKPFADKALQAEGSGFAAFLDSWAAKYRDSFDEYAKWEPAGEWTKGENYASLEEAEKHTDRDVALLLCALSQAPSTPLYNAYARTEPWLLSACMITTLQFAFYTSGAKFLRMTLKDTFGSSVSL